MEWAAPDVVQRVKVAQRGTFPAKQAEQLVASVDFRRKKTRKKEEWWTFTYKAPWGPAHKMRRSIRYPSKAAAAQSIHKWAGSHWPQRVKCKALAATVFATTNQQEQAKKEHRISMQIWHLWQDYLRWLGQEFWTQPRAASAEGAGGCDGCQRSCL